MYLNGVHIFINLSTLTFYISAFMFTHCRYIYYCWDKWNTAKLFTLHSQKILFLLCT